jgi:hypothetical protein
MRTLLPVIALYLFVPEVSCFSLLRSQASTPARTVSLFNKISDNDAGDFPAFPEGTEYTGNVDWDAEWKKVVKEKTKITTKERPGSGYYKSEAEIAAIVRFWFLFGRVLCFRSHLTDRMCG